jgi:hypothetical protein
MRWAIFWSRRRALFGLLLIRTGRRIVRSWARRLERPEAAGGPDVRP